VSTLGGVVVLGAIVLILVFAVKPIRNAVLPYRKVRI